MAVVLANPAWPVVGVEMDGTSAPPSVPGPNRRSIDAGYRRLAVRAWSTDRGRQFELDQVQAGTLLLDVVDPLEQLNPDNAGSPFNTGGASLTPYRALWLWAMWPNQPGSGNIINPQVSAVYDSSFETGTGGWAPAGGTTTLVQSFAQAFHGTKSLLVTQSAAGAGFGATNGFPCVPGLTYTVSCYVWLTGGATAAIQVTDAGGVLRAGSSTAVQGAWTRLSVTWNCVDTLETVTVYGTGTATPMFYMDATMLDFGAVANVFTTTGPTLYPILAGYAERFPTSYDMSGFRALHRITVVDALAVLARLVIAQSYKSTVLADNPTVFVPFSNSKPPTSASALSAGRETARGAAMDITGNPAYFPSPTGSIDWAGDQQPDGSSAVVFSQQNATKPPSGGGVGGVQLTYMDVLGGSLALDTSAGCVIEFWARITAGGVNAGGMYRQVPGGGTNFPILVPALTVESFNGGGFGFRYNPDGSTFFGNSVNPPGGRMVPDGVWHYFAQTLAGGQWKTMLDAAEAAYLVASVGVLGMTVQCHFCASTNFGDPQAQMSVARFALYSADIGNARRLAHYQRGVGYVGEVSGARVARLLAQYWAGPTSVAVGSLALAADHTYNGRVLLDVLLEIQESERGLVYANAAGAVMFEDRSSRYVNQTSLWVFGENPAGTSPVEYPYYGYEPELDPTYTFSDANLSRPGNSSFAPIVNAATRALYGQRVLSQQVQCTTDADLTQAGIFYTNRYANPKTRLAKLTLRPSSNPVLWPVVLSLELSQRIRVIRRNAGLTVTGEYYVEKISHRVDAERGEWLVELLASPVFVPSAWVLADATRGVLGTTTVPIY